MSVATILDGRTGQAVGECAAPRSWNPRDMAEWHLFRAEERQRRVLDEAGVRDLLSLAAQRPDLVAAQTSPGYAVTSGTSAHALAAATAETSWNLIAHASVGVHVVEFGISFDGVTASAVPVNVELCQSTQAGAGTPGASPTPTQIRGRTTTVGVTAGVAYTAEPTTLTPVKHWLVTPNGGLFVIQAPLGREIETDLSGGTIKGVALRATAPATVNCRSYAEFERL